MCTTHPQLLVGISERGIQPTGCQIATVSAWHQMSARQCQIHSWDWGHCGEAKPWEPGRTRWVSSAQCVAGRICRANLGNSSDHHLNMSGGIRSHEVHTLPRSKIKWRMTLFQLVIFCVCLTNHPFVDSLRSLARSGLLCDQRIDHFFILKILGIVIVIEKVGIENGNVVGSHGGWCLGGRFGGMDLTAINRREAR